MQQNLKKKNIYVYTHTHTHIYIYIYICQGNMGGNNVRYIYDPAKGTIIIFFCESLGKEERDLYNCIVLH